jgi:2-(acetamidomethylene)succinate hydrolase
VELPAGRFRLLRWEGDARTAIFLHGLTGVAEVWGPTVEALRPDRPVCLALDQRGHGHSPKPGSGYAVTDYVADLLALVRKLHLEGADLVGHSMGARVAMVAAARHPRLFRSVAIVDIGPEQWAANHRATVAALDRMAASYPNADAAVGGAASGRPPGAIVRDLAEARPDADVLRAIALARLRTAPDGTVTWLADREALKQTVVAHRSRNYWRDWERISIPALFVHGAASNEVRPAIAEAMRRRNPRVRYHALQGIGHNIPLLAPRALGEALRDFWSMLPESAT